MFDNLKKRLKAESESRYAKFCADLEKEVRKDIASPYSFYGGLMTKTTRPKAEGWKDDELRTYLKKRFAARLQKALTKELAKLDEVATAPEVTSIRINVEWVKSRMWGANPKAEAWVNDDGGRGQYLKDSDVSGCGYDKGSTSVANILRQVPGITRKLYEVADKAKRNRPLRDIFAYGAGYGILPYIEGGVGVSCYPAIFEKIGYKFETIASGRSFDTYLITKIEKK